MTKIPAKIQKDHFTTAEGAVSIRYPLSILFLNSKNNLSSKPRKSDKNSFRNTQKVQKKNKKKKTAYICLLWRPFCSAERNKLSNFGKGSLEAHFCKIVLKSGHLPRSRCRFKVIIILALAAILFSRSERFLQFGLRVLSGTFLSNYLENRPLA